MSSAASNPRSTSEASAGSRRTRRLIVIAVAVLAAIVVVFLIFTNFYTEVLWYEQLGYVQVLLTQWIWFGVMFAIGFVGLGVPIWLSLTLAYRARPIYAKLNSQLAQYQQLIEPVRKVLFIAVPAVFGFFGGMVAANSWPTVLMWANAVDSGVADPQFGMDNSFYLFDLPFWGGLVSFAMTTVVISLIVTIAVGYLYGGIRLNNRELSIAKGLRIQLAVTAALLAALIAASLWLDRYRTLVNDSGMMTGAGYSDVHAVIPGKTILAAIAVVVGLIFLVTAFVGKWRLAVVGTGLFVVSALVIGVAFPAVVQQFQVRPSERQLEEQYLQRNIDATNAAYGLESIDRVAYAATTDTEPGALRQDAETTASIRLLDPLIVSPGFRQLQQFKQYYSFNDQLDVDRYSIDGENRDTVLGVRELDLSGLGDSQTWVNNTIVYTHGYGLVAAYGNETQDGLPRFFESGIPSSGALGEFEPRIYFGEKSPTYSIVGAPEGATPVELDYPAGGADSDSVTYTTFEGDGGPTLDNVFKRLMYAVKFQSEQIFLSSSVTDSSQILYDRDPVTRVQKAAPYLQIDSDPYPAVVDGRILWIVDGYTTSANYPYSNVESFSNAISDTRTTSTSLSIDNVNYIRNSVKATVDAYDGSVTLYAWDDEDPVLQTWQKIFPNTLKPYSEMSGELMSHVRYPSDLFKAQRQVLATYHVTDAGSFYSQEDAWQVPTDPTAGSNSTAKQPPYYLTMQMPDADSASFSIYSTYIPISTSSGSTSRNVLVGYLSANADAGSTAGVKSADYGTLTLLTLPRETTVPGPGQVQNTFNTDSTVSPQLNLLDQGGSQVEKGNLLTLPVGGGLLYVQPVFVRSSGETSYPILQKVLVAFGDQIAFEDTLDEALDSLFGGDSGASAGDSDSTDGSDSDSGDAGGSGDVDTNALDQALADAQQALTEREAAREAGDWAAYGTADQALQDALERAVEATE